MHAGNPRLNPSSFVPSPPQFVTMTEPPPLAYTGPFQIIEPGSELYIETEPNFCLELLPEEGLDTSGGLFLSENGIPAEVLEDVFRLDDELGGVVLPGPVPNGVTMDRYEAQLVAEIERLFPESVPSNTVVQKRTTSGSGGVGARFAEELARKIQTAPVIVSNSPCYMNVFLKGAAAGFLQGNVGKSDPPQPTERGYRCVEMIDAAGTMFKAKYYADQMVNTTTTTTPVRPSTPVPRVMSFTKFSTPSPQQQQQQTPTRLPKLKNMTPAMASKIESLANGLNRNVTLTPVRTPSRNSLLSTPSSSTIVIKAPKRTIASGGSSSSTNAPKIFPDPFFPMPIIKQEPLDEFPTSPPEEDPLNIPSNPPKPRSNPQIQSQSKQPRKQKLVKLSQNGEVVFNDTTNVGGAARRQEGIARSCGQKVRAPPPPQQLQGNSINSVGDKNRSSGSDISEPKKHPQHRTSTPNRHPPKPSRSSLKLLPSLTPSQCNSNAKPIAAVPAPAPPTKRTRYRVHMTQTQLPQQQHRPGVSKRVPVNQIIESIEILDSSDEDEEETTTAPESSEPESDVGVVVAKLPGNTESIQCSYCCRIFRSSQAVLEHAKNCADASLFRQISKRGQGQSLLKGNFSSTIATRRRSPEPKPSPRPVLATPKKKNRPSTTSSSTSTPMTTKRSERLSIEILPSAFNIDNLLHCEACQKSFRTVEHLQQHQRIHQAPIVCEFCKKKFYESLAPKHVCQEKKRSMKLKRARN